MGKNILQFNPFAFFLFFVELLYFSYVNSRRLQMHATSTTLSIFFYIYLLQFLYYSFSHLSFVVSPPFLVGFLFSPRQFRTFFCFFISTYFPQVRMARPLFFCFFFFHSPCSILSIFFTSFLSSFSSSSCLCIVK
jgi:hypothetical protein